MSVPSLGICLWVKQAPKTHPKIIVWVLGVLSCTFIQVFCCCFLLVTYEQLQVLPERSCHLLEVRVETGNSQAASAFLLCNSCALISLSFCYVFSLPLWVFSLPSAFTPFLSSCWALWLDRRMGTICPHVHRKYGAPHWCLTENSEEAI